MLDSYLFRAVRLLISVIEPNMMAEGLGRLSGNKKKLDELVACLLSTKGLGISSNIVDHPEEAEIHLNRTNNPKFSLNEDAHVAICAIKELLRRFCRLPRRLCVQLIQLHRSGGERMSNDGISGDIEAYRTLLDSTLSASKMELLGCLFHFLRDIHTVQTGTETLEAVLKRRKLLSPEDDIVIGDYSTSNLGNAVNGDGKPAGRGLKAMDCSNLGRVFAPALFAWDDVDDEPPGQKASGEQEFKDMAFLVDSFNAVVSHLIMISPWVWVRNINISESLETQIHIAGKDSEVDEQIDKIVRADCYYRVGLEALRRLIVFKMKIRMLKVPIDKAGVKNESTQTYLTPSPVASRHILSTNPNRKKGSDIKRRVIITESDGEEVEMIQFSDDSTSSSRSSDASLSPSRSSMADDEFTVYQSSNASVHHRLLRQKAISAFTKAAFFGHAHSKIELTKLLFFGFTEDEEMPAMAAISLSSPDSTNAAVFAEELEGYADHPSFKDAKRTLGFISELPTKENDHEALLLIARVIISDALRQAKTYDLETGNGTPKKRRHSHIDENGLLQTLPYDRVEELGKLLRGLADSKLAKSEPSSNPLQEGVSRRYLNEKRKNRKDGLAKSHTYRNNYEENWKSELAQDLVGSGSVPILFSSPADEAKFLCAIACCSALALDENQPEPKNTVLGHDANLEIAYERLRSLLTNRHHVTAQTFYSGQLSKLAYSKASSSLTNGNLDTFQKLASIASDASNCEASFALALHNLSEYEKRSRNSKDIVDKESASFINEQIETWKLFWESIRYLWKAKGQGHPRARFLLFDLCSQITSIAQQIYYFLYPGSKQGHRSRSASVAATHSESQGGQIDPRARASSLPEAELHQIAEGGADYSQITEMERAWFLELVIKLFLCAALSSSRFSTCAPPLTPELSSSLLLPNNEISPRLVDESVPDVAASEAETPASPTPKSPNPKSPAKGRGSIIASMSPSIKKWFSRGSLSKGNSANNVIAAGLQKLQRVEAVPSGQAEAEFGLGYLHEYGIGVVKDDKVAEAWYRRSTLHGNAKAANNLGLLLFRRYQARIKDPNLKESELNPSLLEEAVSVLKTGIRMAEEKLSLAKNSKTYSASSLDEILASADSFTEDAEELSPSLSGWRKWLSGLLCNLGLLHDEEAESGGLDKPKIAKKLYKKASHLGNVEAMTNLSLLYLSGRSSSKSASGEVLLFETTENQRKKALKWMQKAADSGMGVADYHLSVWYETGAKVVGGKRDPYKAMFHCNRAVQNGFNPRSEQTALMTEMAKRLATIQAKYDIQISQPSHPRQADLASVVSSLIDNYSHVARLEREGEKRQRERLLNGEEEFYSPKFKLGSRTSLAAIPVLKPKPSSPATTGHVSARQVREFLKAKKKSYEALLKEAEITYGYDQEELNRARQEIKEVWAGELADFEKHMLSKSEGIAPAADHTHESYQELIMFQIEAEKVEFERTLRDLDDIENNNNLINIPLPSATSRKLATMPSLPASESGSNIRRWHQEKERLERECLRSLAAQVVDHAVLEASESDPIDISLYEREVCIQQLLVNRQFRYSCLSSMVSEVEPDTGTASRRAMDFEKRMLLASMIATFLQSRKFQKRATQNHSYDVAVNSVLEQWKSQLALYRV